MIITADALRSVGTCEESLKHFIEVLGRGDPNFSIEYREAMRYLLSLKRQDPEKYGTWPGFILKVKSELEQLG